MTRCLHLPERSRPWAEPGNRWAGWRGVSRANANRTISTIHSPPPEGHLPVTTHASRDILDDNGPGKPSDSVTKEHFWVRLTEPLHCRELPAVSRTQECFLC